MLQFLSTYHFNIKLGRLGRLYTQNFLKVEDRQHALFEH